MLFRLYLILSLPKWSFCYPNVLNLCQKSRTINSCDQQQFVGQYFYNLTTGRCEPISRIDSYGRPCNLDSDVFPSLARCQILCRQGRNDPYGIRIENYRSCDSVRCHTDAQCSVNTGGRFVCTCKPGFTGDGYSSCVVDQQRYTQVAPSVITRPCGRVTCHSNAQCLVNDGQAKCACRSGSSGDGYISCTADQELYSPTIPQVVDRPCQQMTCHSNARCAVTDGRASCACKSGYSGDGYISCIVNQRPHSPVIQQAVARQCESQLCHTDAQCAVVDGRAACSCKSGFTGDGYSTCVMDQQRPAVTHFGIPRCNHLVCGRRAECIRTEVQGYECRCRQGYAGDGHRCAMPAVRARVTPFTNDVLGRRDCSMIRCDPNAQCIDHDGKAYCRCGHGYAGSGQFCTRDRNSCYDRFDSRYGEQCGEYSYTKFFYHDPASGRCRMFWYGKCMDGITSRNIFSDENSCSSLCSTTGSPIWAAPYMPEPYNYGSYAVEKCLLPVNRGYWCGSQASGRFYYYDRATQDCRQFYYHGCDGNDNRFSSMQECSDRCSGLGFTASVSALPSNCVAPVDLGFQSSTCVPSARYYYDQNTEKCRKFEYAGCRGNANNFRSFQECSQLCRKVDRGHRYLSPPNLGAKTYDWNERNLCSLPKMIGSCSTFQKMYYYEPNANDCQEFYYSGCGGNANKFEHYQQCLDRCGNRRK